jgi:hypothetical protein
VPAADPVEFSDALAELGTSWVIVVAPEALSAQVRLGATVAVGRWPKLNLALRTSSHGPLALYVALDFAATLGNDPALAVALFDRMLEHSWSAAVVSSVAKLDSPAPNISQHLSSFLPGSRFLLRHQPDPKVLSLRATATYEASGVPCLLVVEEGGDVPSSLVERVHRASGAEAVHQVSVPGDWHPVYGGHAAQLAVVPSRVAPAWLQADSRCPSCELLLGTPICPFCRIAGRVSAPVGGHS